MSDPRWLDTTKNHELRDALNFVGIPASADGATLATQQGTRGSPIVDASCIPGLELYKVAATAGQGNVSNNAFESSGDYMWASAGNLDLSFLMWNSPAANNRNRFNFGILLRGDTASEVQVDDVLGRDPSQLVLVSGTHAWRMTTLNAPALLAGQTITAGGVSFNGWSDGLNNIGSQFLADTPLPFLVWRTFSTNTAGAPGVAASSLPRLLTLMTANYATFRIYDFTLRDEDPSVAPIPATMPPSMSGANTNTQSIPDPDDISQTILNPSYYYISDAIVAPRSPRSIVVQPTWTQARSVAVDTDLSFNISEAFLTSPSGETTAVGFSPASRDNATYSLNRGTGVFTFRASVAGVYRVIFTGVLRSEPGKRAEAILDVTVS